MRASGILLPVASLPSKYGIGGFSKQAYKFVDQLKLAGQKYWQILPLGPTSFGDSPYQSFSAYAGNPYFIDLETLVENGYLNQNECDIHNGKYINYGKLYKERFKVLKKAFERFNTEEIPFQKFLLEHKSWLPDYALYMAIKNDYHGVSWNLWEEDIKVRKPEALAYYKEKCKDEIKFYEFQQYMFYKQWGRLKKYANEQGIKIIGDIPIYVAFDSADSWTMPELFQFDDNRMPTAVAGCPPDAFSKTGQLWGNPLYQWKYHKLTDYEWWVRRISHCFQLYDMVRVDHFRGFDEYYSIPYGNRTAEYGTWEKGPGNVIFETLKRQLGNVNIIAEDLGYLTESVIRMVKKTGFPGMKILQFAFDSREESDYLPHNYEKNCVVYTGTHDNDTILGWYQVIPEADRQLAEDYLNLHGKTQNEIPLEFIRLAMASVAELCIIPLQDYLALGSDARINIPSTVGSNWRWRLREGEFTKELCEKIRKITKIYCR